MVSLCEDTVSSRRGLLALLWMIVSLLTAAAFLLALIFTLSAKDDGDYDYYYDGEEGQDDADAEMAVTSRAMAFAALWTAVLATLMAIFGTVILGWQSPISGQYYTCCSSRVHKTTPLALGSFIGALLMFANLTLVCSVLFGEFEVSRWFRWSEILSRICSKVIDYFFSFLRRFEITNEKESRNRNRKIQEYTDRPWPFR